MESELLLRIEQLRAQRFEMVERDTKKKNQATG